MGKYEIQLAPFYGAQDPTFVFLRTKVKEILQHEEDLNEIVQLVGKDSLAESAKIIREDYLQQNAYTPYDNYCPFYKSVWMLRNIVEFHEAAQKAIESSTAERKITWNTIKSQLNQLIYKVTSMKFQDCKVEGEEAVCAHYKALNEEIVSSFNNLDE